MEAINELGKGGYLVNNNDMIVLKESGLYYDDMTSLTTEQKQLIEVLKTIKDNFESYTYTNSETKFVDGGNNEYKFDLSDEKITKFVYTKNGESPVTYEFDYTNYENKVNAVAAIKNTVESYSLIYLKDVGGNEILLDSNINADKTRPAQISEGAWNMLIALIDMNTNVTGYSYEYDSANYVHKFTKDGTVYEIKLETVIGNYMIQSVNVDVADYEFINEYMFFIIVINALETLYDSLGGVNITLEGEETIIFYDKGSLREDVEELTTNGAKFVKQILDIVDNYNDYTIIEEVVDENIKLIAKDGASKTVMELLLEKESGDVKYYFYESDTLIGEATIAPIVE